MLSDKIFRLHLQKSIDPEFFVAAFSGSFLRGQIERGISGAEGLANNLPQGVLKDFWVAVPPLDEQDSIVRHILAEQTRLEKLIAESQRAIELLRERRAGLISAAVAGQIDVRAVATSEGA